MTDLSLALLRDIREAAAAGEFALLAKYMRRALQPYGIEVTPRDAFEHSDKVLLHEFWCRTLGITSTPLDEPLECVAPLYGLIYTAADPCFSKLQGKARRQAAEVASICDELLGRNPPRRQVLIKGASVRLSFG